MHGEDFQKEREHYRPESHDSQQDSHASLLAQKAHCPFTKDDPEKQVTHLEHRRASVSHPHSFLGFSIAGCELESGPVFNFARIWSHMAASVHVADSFAMLSQRQKNKQTVNGLKWEPHNWTRNFEGTPQQLSKYCSAAHKDEPNLSIHGKTSADLINNCILAAFMAIILQWGSTGAAILIAYK